MVFLYYSSNILNVELKIKIFMGLILMKNLKLEATSNLIQDVNSVITS